MRTWRGGLFGRAVVEAVEIREPRLLTTLGWWVATVAVLVVVDDLTFGPAFWAVSRLWGSMAAAGLAFVIYTVVQVWLVRSGTAESPCGLAVWLLQRLQLERKNRNVAENEQRLHSWVGAELPAVLITPVIGGVLPPLILYKLGYPAGRVRALSLVCAPIYAAEFAFLHGWIPGSI